MRITLALSAVSGLCAAAAAQSFTTDSSIDFTLTWREATSSGGTSPGSNGILDPGEFALITLTTSFTNENGTAGFSPPIGTFTSGTIRGFGTAFLDINGNGNDSRGAFNIDNPPANAAGTAGFGVRSVWRLVGNGTVNPASNGIINLQFGQFVASPALARTENPITNVYRFLWVPNSFAVPFAVFTPAGASIAGNQAGAVYLDFDGAVGASVYVDPSNITYHGVSIPIDIPSPATLALLGLAAAMRRRRSS